MPSEILQLTTAIVTAHSSSTELTSEQLIQEIKDVHAALAALESGEILGEAVSGAAEETAGMKKPSIPLKNIVTVKFVTCLECGTKLKTLKTHLRKAHGLIPKEYYQRFDLDPKKYPLVCKEYSAKRSEMAKARGFGQGRGRKKAETSS